MYFITLTKWKSKPTKDIIDNATKEFAALEKRGIKLQVYWTLGRYDAVSILEAPTEQDAMRILIPFVGLIDTETLTAVPRDEAIKLL